MNFWNQGFAYVEFTDKDSVSTAMALDESLFRGRQIKVLLFLMDIIKRMKKTELITLFWSKISWHNEKARN